MGKQIEIEVRTIDEAIDVLEAARPGLGACKIYALLGKCATVCPFDDGHYGCNLPRIIRVLKELKKE